MVSLRGWLSPCFFCSPYRRVITGNISILSLKAMTSIVLKKKDAPYLAGKRSKVWQKLINYKEAEWSSRRSDESGRDAAINLKNSAHQAIPKQKNAVKAVDRESRANFLFENHGSFQSNLNTNRSMDRRDELSIAPISGGSQTENKTGTRLDPGEAGEGMRKEMNHHAPQPRPGLSYRQDDDSILRTRHHRRGTTAEIGRHPPDHVCV
jgi:hypothetical protein